MAILDKKAVQLVNILSMLGLNNDIVEVLTADPDLNKISVKIKNTFFFQTFILLFIKFIINFK